MAIPDCRADESNCACNEVSDSLVTDTLAEVKIRNTRQNLFYDWNLAGENGSDVSAACFGGSRLAHDRGAVRGVDCNFYLYCGSREIDHETLVDSFLRCPVQGQSATYTEFQ